MRFEAVSLHEDHGGSDSCHEPTSPEVPAGPQNRILRFPKITFAALWLVLSALLVVASATAYLTAAPRASIEVPAGATIYYNEACGDCAVYLQGELLPALADGGVGPIAVKDYINDRTFREELTALNDGLGIPFTLQSHLATFVRTSRLIIFEGHVPASLITQALAGADGRVPDNMLLYQDSMGSVSSYRAWAFVGSPQEYPISEPISTYYTFLAGSGGGGLGDGPILPIVLVTGLLDGLNPCAFAVLLFFVSFLYAVRAPRSGVLRAGSLYIYAVFLVYFLIGLGLMQAILLTGDPHFMAKLGSALVIGLGALTLSSVVFPKIPLVAMMPSAAWPRGRSLLMKGSMPSATVAGLVVGLCTFPCSGGIYVAILGLLAAKGSFLEGLGYLYLYNLMFVVPLIAMLAVVSNRRVAVKAAQWERSNARNFKAVMAGAMVVMGAVILALVW